MTMTTPNIQLDVIKACASMTLSLSSTTCHNFQFVFKANFIVNKLEKSQYQKISLLYDSIESS
jgi:hypothetical protein